MHDNIIFIALTFIVVVAVILTVDSLTTAISIISLLASFLVICMQFNKVSKMTMRSRSSEPTIESLDDIAPTDGTEDVNLPNEIIEPEDSETQDVYEDYYKQWDAYRGPTNYTYNNPSNTGYSEENMSADLQMMRMGAHRQRDREAVEGAVVKDANFYKYHFAHELSEEENAPWWGRSEV